MKQPLKYRFEKTYPKLIEHPIRLNLAEIENPISVIQEFFTQHGLKNIRIYLEELLSDAIKNSEVISANYNAPIFNELEKVIEAAFLLQYLDIEEEDYDTMGKMNNNEKVENDEIIDSQFNKSHFI